MEAMREELRALVGIIPSKDREKIANYLRAGEVIFALMEHTRDVLGRFEMPRGSGLATDVRSAGCAGSSVRAVQE
jgi:hypothetical protein